jgi:integrase
MMREPRIGSQKVGSIEPIRDVQDVERIRGALWERPRDLLLFDLATRMGVRMRDLLRLRVGDLRGLQVGDELSIGQGRRTRQRVVMDKVVYETFQRYLGETGGQPDDYLFRLRRGTKPLDASQVSRMIRRWFETVGLDGLNGSRSLHKTWEVHYGSVSPPRETVSE